MPYANAYGIFYFETKNRFGQVSMSTLCVALDRVTYISGNPNALVGIYRIDTRMAGPVYMHISGRTTGRSVVVVDAKLFVKAWRRGAGPAWLGWLYCCLVSRWKDFDCGERYVRWLPYRSVGVWSRDEKFHYADDALRQSREYSVPMPTVAVNSKKKAIEMGNSITRTLWLLVKGAEAFPVECWTEDAMALQRLAGVTWGDPPATAQQITAGYSFEKYIEERLMNMELPREEQGA